jgi:GNAT superfamily N-acetyltransferase
VIEIREAHADDVAFIWSMVVEAVNWDPDGLVLSPEVIAAQPTVDRYVAAWPRPTDIGVVAEADGVPIGACWLRFFDATGPGYGFLAEDIPELAIGVAPGWRGRGVGGRLIEALIGRARARAIGAISLSVDAVNPARRLYERCGFQPVVEHGDAVTMRLDLL